MPTSKKSRRHSSGRARPTDPILNPSNVGGPQRPCSQSLDSGYSGEVGGRAISARNATTHGLFARDVVLPALGEDPAAYETLLEQLVAQLPPRNLLERHYLEQIAAASWRLRRLHRWQAQLYEDTTLTEDQRLDKLDKVLRHENALTRQIDRAVRTLNRDLKWLFESRARAEALYQRDLTEQELREEPELGIEVQRLVWRQLRPTPAPDLGEARLDNAAPTDDSQICQNEPSSSPPLLGAGGPHASQICQNEPVRPVIGGNHKPRSTSEGAGVAKPGWGLSAPDEGR